jgi:hypothetical protein
MEEGLLRARPSINAPGESSWKRTRDPAHKDVGTTKAAAAAPRERLQCLDAARGLNVMLMVFVDNCCDFKSVKWIDHSPWDVVHLADFVMPLFLFMVRGDSSHLCAQGGVGPVDARRLVLTNCMDLSTSGARWASRWPSR